MTLPSFTLQALIPRSVVRGVWERETGGASLSQRWERLVEEVRGCGVMCVE